MWTMVYFRELPESLNEYSEDALDFFFEFANTYTEDSILHGFLKQKKAERNDWKWNKKRKKINKRKKMKKTRN